MSGRSRVAEIAASDRIREQGKTEHDRFLPDLMETLDRSLFTANKRSAECLTGTFGNNIHVPYFFCPERE